MEIILFSAFAGIFGTGLGGTISVIIGKRSPSVTCAMLSFAGGVMISIVCFGLIPEAIELSNTIISVLGIVLGIIVTMTLNRLVDAISEKNQEKLKAHHTPEELYHEKPILNDRRVFLRSGIIMLIAIGLHNLPEGIAIGAGGSLDIELGILLSLMIALHNIPEGMAIAAPLLIGGINKGLIIFLTAVSGAPTLIGGIIGLLIGNISDTAIAVSLAAAGGAMVYVVFGEIIPQAIIMTKNRMPAIITLFGIIVGLLVAQM